jgi:hypothetical protein
MEKYGFVYIWFDVFRKMYYIGSHWGTENDGYICSSNRMRDAYRRRSIDFKRKIITKVYSSKTDLLKKEYEYLSLIKEEELGKKYYNLTKHLNGHWFTEEEKAKTLSEKISIKTKEAMYRPDIREKYLAGLATRDNRAWDPEVRAKMSASNKGKNTGKDNSKAHEMAAAANRGKKHSEERINQIRETSKFKELNNMKIKCLHCDFVGNKGNVARYHNDKCKHKLSV